jgi:hypothetical protein
MLPVVLIWKNVFCSPDIPLTFKDEHVNKLFIVDVPKMFSDYEHVTALLNFVEPVIYNDVFIETR